MNSCLQCGSYSVVSTLGLCQACLDHQNSAQHFEPPTRAPWENDQYVILREPQFTMGGGGSGSVSGEDDSDEILVGCSVCGEEPAPWFGMCEGCAVSNGNARWIGNVLHVVAPEDVEDGQFITSSWGYDQWEPPDSMCPGEELPAGPCGHCGGPSSMFYHGEYNATRWEISCDDEAGCNSSLWDHSPHKALEKWNRISFLESRLERLESELERYRRRGL